MQGGVVLSKLGDVSSTMQEGTLLPDVMEIYMEPHFSLPLYETAHTTMNSPNTATGEHKYNSNIGILTDFRKCVLGVADKGQLGKCENEIMTILTQTIHL